MDIDHVLNAYREGDEDKRLSLFLFNRDLRDEFRRIDEDTTVEQAPANASHGVTSLLRSIGLKCRSISARVRGTVVQWLL